MPAITRVLIKTSLVYLVLALLVGLLLAFRVATSLPAWVYPLTPVYFHLFMVGWVSQLIFGVVMWMFPKYSLAQPRGDDRLAWTMYALLNIGLALRLIAEPAVALQPGTAWGWLLALSAVLQWLAGLLFVFLSWPRVKER